MYSICRMPIILYIFSLLLLLNVALGAEIQTKTQVKVRSVFDEVNANYSEIWKGKWIPFDAAMKKSLQEGFGRSQINLEQLDLDNRLLLAKGFFIETEDRYIFHSNLRMSHLPRPKTSYVRMNPGSMLISVEISPEPIILIGEYFMFGRGKSFKPWPKSSPFAIANIESQGQLSIIAEDCQLSGRGLLLIEQSGLSMRNHHILLKNCKISVEISNYENPPLIETNFFTPTQRKRLELLMSNPIRDHLETLINSALYTINMRSLINSELLLQKLIRNEMMITHEMNNLMDNIVKGVNSKGFMFKERPLNNLDMFLNFTVRTQHVCTFKLSNIKLLGLDSVYSKHEGGAFAVYKQIYFTERLAFAGLLVTGELYMKDKQTPFSVEISDLTADVLIRNTNVTVNVNYWRAMGIHIVSNEFDDSGPTVQDLIIAYLYHILPEYIEEFLKDGIKDGLNGEVVHIPTTPFDICKTNPSTETAHPDDNVLREQLNALDEESKGVNAKLGHNLLNGDY